MFNSLTKKISLQENEKIVRVVRSHPLAFLWSILFSVILVVSPFFFLYFLLQKERWGIVIFFSLVAAATFYIIRIWILWYFNCWLITNLKIIDVDQRKLFDRRISEIPLETIKDISYRTKGITATLFRLGEIEILTSDDKLSFILKKAACPQEALRLINELKLKKVEREIYGKDLTAEELVKLVEKIKRGLGEEKFRELVGL